jgi:hypothetical protein
LQQSGDAAGIHRVIIAFVSIVFRSVNFVFVECASVVFVSVNYVLIEFVGIFVIIDFFGINNAGETGDTSGSGSAKAAATRATGSTSFCCERFTIFSDDRRRTIGQSQHFDHRPIGAVSFHPAFLFTSSGGNVVCFLAICNQFRINLDSQDFSFPRNQ